MEETADFLAGRINPGLPPDRLRASLDAVRERFGADWIDANRQHPIGKLWRRGDFLSTCELFWIGESLLRLDAIDPRWTTSTIERMRDSHSNSRVGHAFELLLGGALATEGQVLKPAPPGNPAFDFDVEVFDGPKLRLSFKNFGTTTRDAEFQKRSRELEAIILNRAEQDGLRWIGLALECDHYPSNEEWKVVESELRRVWGQHSAGFTAPGWTVRVTASPLPENELEASRTSCGIFITAPHHVNEQKNFLDKIHRECLKFNDSCGSINEEVVPVVLFRITESAPLQQYVQWGREYLARENVRIRGLWFYQSAIVQTVNDSTGLQHHMSCSNDAFPGKPPSLNFAVGILSRNPVRNELRTTNGAISLAGRHWYQRHELFQVRSWTEEGCSIDMRLQPGVVHHGVMSLPGGDTVVLSPKQRAFDYVTIFT